MDLLIVRKHVYCTLQPTHVGVRTCTFYSINGRESELGKVITIYAPMIYDLYGPVRNAFEAGSIHYEGKWEGFGPWKSRVVWVL